MRVKRFPSVKSHPIAISVGNVRTGFRSIFIFTVPHEWSNGVRAVGAVGVIRVPNRQ